MLIAHASDSPASDEPAFVHALALAARAGASLVSVHLHAGTAPSEPPSAANVLRRFGLREDAVEHRWVVEPIGDDASEGLLAILARLSPDLLVIGTHGRSGPWRLLGGSVAESLARNLTTPTLLLPIAARGFVDAVTFAPRLPRMLVAAGSARDAQCGVDAAVMLAHLSGVRDSEIALVHVSDGTEMPEVSVPESFAVSRRIAAGSVESAVIADTRALDPAVVVMATQGHDTLGDVLLGSHTERVLHAIERPLLWVPCRAAPAA